MFCGKCGAENAEGAAFCEKCGASLKKPSEDLGAAPKGKGKNPLSKVLVALVVVAVIAAAAVLMNRSGESTPEAAAENVVNVLLSGDPKAFLDQLPPKLVKAMMEEEGLKNKAELAEVFSDSMDNVTKLVERSGVKLKAKSVGRSSSGVDTAALKNAKDIYGEYGMKVTSYTYVNVEVTARVNGETATIPVNYVPVAKIDGAWYVDFNTLNMGSVYNALSSL